MSDDSAIDIPKEWRNISDAQLSGLIMVTGGPSSGKSTLCRYLYQRLSAAGRRVAYLDGDPGQTVLGPPSTITLGLGTAGNATFPPAARTWRRFVGAVTPRGHMLSLVVGSGRLAAAAAQAGADAIIFDTSGLIDPRQGGLSLRLAEMDLLRPRAVIAIQAGRELEPFLVPLRRSRRAHVIELRPSPAALYRSPARRQKHRMEQYAGHFAGARPLTVDWSTLPVFPAPRFYQHQLIALEDIEGYTLALGIVLESDAHTGKLRVHTALASLQKVNALHLGDLIVEPVAYRDQALAALFRAGSPPAALTGTEDGSG